jgi:integrase
MIDLSLKHLVADTDRHGNMRYYVRVKGAKKKRVRGDPTSPEFMLAYVEALDLAQAEAKGETAKKREAKGSVGWLIEKYLASTAFLDELDEVTRKRRVVYMAEFRGAHGSKSISGMTRKALQSIMDAWRRKHGPHAANDRLKTVRALWGFAVKQDYLDRDVSREVKAFRPKGEGFHTWTPSEIARFLAHWPAGSAPRLAMTLMLCTGLRRDDAWRVGPQHVHKGRIRYTPLKTAKTSGVSIDIPIIPMLRDALKAGPQGGETFVVSKHGRTFKNREAFGNSFKQWCREAGLPHCSAHGLRKGGATLLAERGVSEAQLKAIFAWTDGKMPSLYTRKARAGKLSDVLEGGFGLEDDDDDKG